MFNLILCEDDKACLAQLTGALEAQAGGQLRIWPFDDPDRIPDSVLSGCDIALLDIDFAGKGTNGIDLARRIRERRRDAVILFVTNFIEYAPEGYEVGAFRYLLKSELTRKLPGYLREALSRCRAAQETLKIRVNGEPHSIPLSGIRYIESQQHTVLVHTARQQYRYYSSLTELEAQLEQKGFLRIHKSYLVNMAHLQRYQSQGAELLDGTQLPVSEKRYAVQKKKYLFWKGL